MITVIENVFSDFDAVRQYALSRDYCDVVNPADGEVYPGISLDIPDISELIDKLSVAAGAPITVHSAFMRLTNENTAPGPTQAHTDTIMGDFLSVTYLTDGIGGTSLVEHIETGLRTEPKDSTEEESWIRDTCDPDKWNIYDMVTMKANRAMTLSSKMMHRPEPVGGFGEGIDDGRLVLVVFYSIAKPEIKVATIEDIPRLVEYGSEFWSQTMFYKDGIEYDVETVTAVSTQLLDDGIVLYAEMDNRIVALMLVMVMPFPMNANYSSATEWVFHVDHEYRRSGLGLELINLTEQVLVDMGVTYFSMVSLANVTPEAANKLYEKLGFVESEKTFTKKLRSR